MPKEIMDKKRILVIAIVVLVILSAVGSFFFLNSRPPQQASKTALVSTTGVTKEFTVTASSYAFDVKEMKVNKGDLVRIKFINTEASHDWVIDEFNARTNRIGAGQSETVEFVPDKTGTFEYYCSVTLHRQFGMKGNLIVE
jgi:plastocyanin